MNVFNSLEIETIGSCNRVCSTCLRQSYPDKNNATHQGRFPVSSTVGDGLKMPESTFKRIIDQSVEMGFNGVVCLNHLNEPLLDDRLARLGEYVKSKPQIKRLWANSNMDLITPERAKELDGIFDHFTVALYMSEEKQRVREEYLNNLFQKTTLHFTKGVHVITHYSPFTNLNAAIEAHRDEPCTYYNDRLIVSHNGTIMHCCDDTVGNFGLGSVNMMSVREIWESEKHQQLVKDISVPGGRGKYYYCSICPRTDG